MTDFLLPGVCSVRHTVLNLPSADTKPTSSIQTSFKLGGFQSAFCQLLLLLHSSSPPPNTDSQGLWGNFDKCTSKQSTSNVYCCFLTISYCDVAVFLRDLNLECMSHASPSEIRLVGHYCNRTPSPLLGKMRESPSFPTARSTHR